MRILAVLLLSTIFANVFASEYRDTRVPVPIPQPYSIDISDVLNFVEGRETTYTFQVTVPKGSPVVEVLGLPEGAYFNDDGNKFSITWEPDSLVVLGSIGRSRTGIAIEVSSSVAPDDRFRRIVWLDVVDNPSLNDGRSFPSHFIGKWKAAERRKELDLYEIKKDMFFTQIITRQVGREGTEIPYPTVCRYKETGVVSSFKEATRENRDRYYDQERPMPDYEMTFVLNSIELIDSDENDEKCERFIELNNGGRGQYRWDITDLDDNTFMKPWHSEVFVKY